MVFRAGGLEMKTIILAGGTGSRLWPLSRKRFPKQFVRIQNKETSLFQDTFLRAHKLSPVEDIYVVTNQDYQFIVKGEIQALGLAVHEGNILIEPEAKNTLPAIYAAVHEINQRASGPMIVLPSDHAIADESAFVKNVQAAKVLTTQAIVTFGIEPTHPNTGYGYIEPGQPFEIGYQVASFKEKPSYAVAKEYIKQGFYWNAGIFLFDTAWFAEEVKTHASDIYEAFASTTNLVDAFGKIERKISIDYGIMEKTASVAVVPLRIGWNDLGTFDAFYDYLDKDEHGNVLSGDVLTYASKNNLIEQEQQKLVALIGMEDTLIIDNRDALLVCKRDYSQHVKEIVTMLEDRNDLRSEYHVQDYRPWGHCKVLEEQPSSFKVKRILVAPGKKLSYQMHHHRSEHWVVVKGTAKVTIDDAIYMVPEGESIYIKKTQKHRLENPGHEDVEIVEVQLGNYLEEDDIIRFDDDFGRQ